MKYNVKQACVFDLILVGIPSNLVFSIHPFHATDLFCYPLKTSENLWFYNVFREYWKRSVAWNGLRTGVGGGSLLNGQNLLSVMKVICRCFLSNTEMSKTYIVYWIKYFYLFLPFSLFAVACASLAFLNGRCFSVLRHSTLQNFTSVTGDHSCRCLKNYVHYSVSSINRKSVQIFLKLKFKQEFLINSSL